MSANSSDRNQNLNADLIGNSPYPSHKSGQAAIVLVVVTVVTVLGIAVASSSQTTVNLRDTVYSTQAAQALACAEAGVDRAMVAGDVLEENEINPAPTVLSSEGADDSFSLPGCDLYTANLNNYPGVDGDNNIEIIIPENVVQEFRTNGYQGSGEEFEFAFSSNTPDVNAGLAVYEYYWNATESEYFVERRMYLCDVGGSPGQSDVGDDFEFKCGDEFLLQNDPVVVRVRPLFTDITFNIDNFQGTTGYQIDSRGTAGSVNRNIQVIRFYSQLGGAFDESIVGFDEDEPLGQPN